MSRSVPPNRCSLAGHRPALLLYSLLSLALTWPLVLHFATHVTGDGIDDPALTWNLWWIKARLVDQVNFDIFHSGWMFHPVEINLAFYTLTPLNGLLSVPLQTTSTLIIANNLLLLSSFILGAYGTYLLCLEVFAACRNRPVLFEIYAKRTTICSAADGRCAGRVDLCVCVLQDFLCKLGPV